MREVLLYTIIISIVALFIYAIIFSDKNYPTWTGIIISGLLGCLVFYLILCFMGIMGEPRYKRNDPYD